MRSRLRLCGVKDGNYIEVYPNYDKKGNLAVAAPGDRWFMKVVDGKVVGKTPKLSLKACVWCSTSSLNLEAKHKEMVAVEIDGSQHLLPDRKNNDDKKDRHLNDLGWVVIRISEKEIKTNINVVFNQIKNILCSKPKINNYKIGLIVKPKRYQKKERNEFGFTEYQIKNMKQQRKVERPPLNELLKVIEENGYRKTGKIFGVSDNSIRKWVKAYLKGLD